MDFFRRNSVILKPGASPGSAAAHSETLSSQLAGGGGGMATSVPALQAQLTEAINEERKLRERCQKLELEKSLLQNFVDKIYGESNEDEETIAAIREFATTEQTRNVALQLELAEKSAALERVTKDYEMETKRCAAFEDALKKATIDLRDADNTRKSHDVQAAVHSDLEQRVAALTRQVSEKDETLAQLMERVASRDAEHARTMKDYEAILEKSSHAHSSAVEELSAKTDALRAAQIEIRKLVEEKRLLQLARDDAAAAANATRSDVVNRFLELALGWVDAVMQTSGASSVEQHEACWMAVESQHRAREAAFQQFVKALQSHSNQLEERMNVKEARIVEMRAFLAQSEERCKAFEEDLAKLSVELRTAVALRDEALSEVEVMRPAAERMRQELAQAKGDLDTVTQKLLDEQRQAQLRQRQSAQKMRDLQDELAATAAAAASAASSPSAVAGGSSHTSKTASSGPSDDVEKLLRKLADAQEKLWLLESAKQSYEAEIDRLTRDQLEKDAIIRTHFYDAAEKVAKQKGKLGAALFRRSGDEVIEQVQHMLQQTLTTNLQLENEARSLRKRLEVAETRVAEAMLQGFELPDDEDDSGAAESRGASVAEDAFS